MRISKGQVDNGPAAKPCMQAQMKERNQQLDQSRAQIKAECWDSMDVHRETVSALKAPLKVRSARCWACVWQCRGWDQHLCEGPQSVVGALSASSCP